jgi:hypothetical protein
MKLFTVSEPRAGDGLVVPGIRIFPSESPMGLRWGSAAREDSKVVPIAKAQYRAVRGALEAHIITPDTACHLVRADVVDAGEKGLKFELEKDESDQRALIYICTRTLATGEGMMRGGAPDDAVPNAVTLTSNEALHVDNGRGPRDRVQRVHKPFSEAVGIERLGVSLVSEDGATWNEALLVLQPGASFRVVRGGDVRDMVPEFVVTWTGHKLRTVVPERWRKREEARHQAAASSMSSAASASSPVNIGVSLTPRVT